MADITYHVKLKPEVIKKLTAAAKAESRTIHNMLQVLIAWALANRS